MLMEIPVLNALAGRKRVPVLIALLGFMLLNVASAQPQCYNNQVYDQSIITSAWSSDFPIALIAVLISFIIATIIFMVGTAFKNDVVRNFGIGEIYEAVATALIVGFFLFIAGLFINAVPANILSTSPSTLNSVNAIEAAQASMDPYVFTLNSICNTVNTIETIYDGNLNGFPGQAPYGVPWWDNTVPGYAGLASVIDIQFDLTFLSFSATSLLSYATAYNRLNEYINYLTPMESLGSLLTDLLYILWSEYYLMIFFSFMSPIFIAGGTVFRAFLPTRSFGGMLIGIGMGFYIVMPVLFSFIYSQCLPGTPGCPLQGISPSQNPFSGILPAQYDAVLQNYWLFFVLYPVMAISVTYLFVTEVANFLGASAQMSNRLRTGFI